MYWEQHEDTGYIGKNNREIIQVMVANLRKRDQKMRFQWVKGHKGHLKTEQAREWRNPYQMRSVWR